MILVAGEALVDLIPDPAKMGAYDAVLGGSPFNVAIGLARLGGASAYVGRLSEDANGEALAAMLADNGVRLDFAERDPRPTPLAFVMRGTAATGSRYSFYLDATAYDGDWPYPTPWPPAAKHLHIGSLTALDPRHGARSLAALKDARHHGATTSFDPNVRPLVTPDREAARGLVEHEVAQASILKASQEDIEWLYPGRALEDVLTDWAKRGPRFVVATLGGKGARVRLGAKSFDVPPIKIEVADTVGAGDSFMSSLLFAMDRDGALGRASIAPGEAQLAQWLAFAAKASAITCARRGSNPPTLPEVEAF